MESTRRRGFFKTLFRYKGRFLIFFVLIFLVSFTLISLLGFVPDEIKIASDEVVGEEAAGEQPIRISVPSINLDWKIENPETNDIKVLDAALKRGVVHYPGSGLLGDGNMFLFGHSSSYKIVNNQAYKVFNRLKELREGDRIYVYSNENGYVYHVRKVTLVDADKALVNLSTKKKMLTLSTCNTFGKTEERYVVEADFDLSFKIPAQTSKDGQTSAR